LRISSNCEVVGLWLSGTAKAKLGPLALSAVEGGRVARVLSSRAALAPSSEAPPLLNREVCTLCCTNAAEFEGGVTRKVAAVEPEVASTTTDVAARASAELWNAPSATRRAATADRIACSWAAVGGAVIGKENVRPEVESTDTVGVVVVVRPGVLSK
jgi:hypothetical protein